MASSDGHAGASNAYRDYLRSDLHDDSATSGADAEFPQRRCPDPSASERERAYHRSVVSHGTRRRVTFAADRFEDAPPRIDTLDAAVDVERLPPPAARRGLRLSLPTEPFPTQEVLEAAACGVQPGRTHEVSSHEVLRHLHVEGAEALDRFAGWWPTSVRVPGGVFEMVDRTTSVVEGRLRRPLARALRVDLALEIHAEGVCAIRLTPELRSRRLLEPTESWWITAHALADVAVAVVRPRQHGRAAC